MKRLMFASLSAIALSGCAGSHLKKLTVCDGKHRRAANVYGSILPVLPVPVPASEAGAAILHSAWPGANGAAAQGPPGAAGTATPMPKTSLLVAPSRFVTC